MAPSRGPQPLARTLHVALNSHKGPVNVARYSKGTAKYILTGGQDRTVRLWNANAGTEIKEFAAHGYEVLSITVYVGIIPSLLSAILTVLKGPRIMPNLRHLEAIARYFSGMLLLAQQQEGYQATWARSMLSNSTKTQVSLRVVSIISGWLLANCQ